VSAYRDGSSLQTAHRAAREGQSERDGEITEAARNETDDRGRPSPRKQWLGEAEACTFS